jgi:hypothetical protein
MKFIVHVVDNTSMNDIIKEVWSFLPRIGEYLNIRGILYQVKEITYEIVEGKTFGQVVYIYVTSNY